MKFSLLLAAWCCCFSSICVAQSFTVADFNHQDSLAIVLMEAGQYQEGLELAQKTTKKAARAFGQSDTTYATALDREGTFYFYLGQFAAAEPLFKQVLAIREAHLDAYHTDIASALSNLSLVYNYQGLTEQALPLSLRAVAIDKKVYGDQHENYSYSINNLGVLYHTMDEYQKAAECFLISLKIDKKTLGEEHPDYMGALLNIGVVYTGLGDYPKAYQYINQAFELYKKHLGLKHPQTLRTLTNLADLHNRIGNYDIALTYNKQAVTLIREVLGDQHPQYAVALTNLGNNYGRIGDYKNAEKYLLQTLSVYEQVFGKDHPNYPSVLAILSHIYIQMQRYQEAENINRQALAAIEKSTGKYSSNYVYALGTLGDLYTMTQQHQKALEVQFQTLSITQNIFDKRHPRVADIYTKIAISHWELEDYPAAITAYQKALSILAEKFGKDHPKYAYSLGALALVYEDQKAYEKAAELYQRAFEIMVATYGNDSHLVTDAWIDLARFHNRKNPTLALHFAIQAIMANAKTNLDSTAIVDSLHQYATPDNFWNITNALASMNQLAIIQLHLYETTTIISYKKQVLKTLEALAKLSRQAQRNLIQEEDQLTAVKYANFAAVDGVKASQELYAITKDPMYLNHAIKFAEHNKSTVLNGILSNNQALSLGGIPDSLVILEKGLKKRIAELQTQIQQAQENKEKNGIAALQKKLVQHTLEQTKLQEKLIQTYPKYNEIRQATTTTDIQQIQTALLDEKTALLEYFIYDTFAYLIVVNPKEAHLIALSDLASIKENVKQLRSSLTNYERLLKNTKIAAVEYVQAAAELYQLLLEPVTSQLSNIEHLIIVADGTLGHIPFEALLTSSWTQEKEVDFRRLPYLMKDYSISYSYSASLLLQNKENTAHQTPNNSQIIGFAAAYPPLNQADLIHRSVAHQEQRLSLGELPAVQKEVKALQTIFPNGDFFYQLDANEATFKQKAGDYAIIHLAMHGILHPHQPLLSSLAFSENLDTTENNFLTAQEITHLPLNSDLVVLSACETGFGKFEEGEGVLSLARSFMYAGVPSLVVSLWQVNDASTAFIMQDFYKNIANGMTKDKALQTAKLTYLNACQSDIAAHPAFWSPFIQLGDRTAIAVGSKNNTWIWWVLGVGILLLIGIGVVKKYTTKAA